MPSKPTDAEREAVEALRDATVTSPRAHMEVPG